MYKLLKTMARNLINHQSYTIYRKGKDGVGDEKICTIHGIGWAKIVLSMLEEKYPDSLFLLEEAITTTDYKIL